MNIVTPYNNKESKKEQVENMFDSIAPKYDFLNHFLSLGIDQYWRRRVIKILKQHKIKNILDIATGTGDLAFAASKLKNVNITGIDLSGNMLEKARLKAKKKKILNIDFKKGDAENLEFKDNTFDSAMVAFGIRNFDDLNKGLKEILRVLKPGAVFVILEFSKPVKFPVKQFYRFYSFVLLPWFGKIFSGDNRAYKYLPESVNIFPEGLELVVILRKAGFKNLTFTPVTFRIVSIYKGIKP